MTARPIAEGACPGCEMLRAAANCCERLRAERDAARLERDGLLRELTRLANATRTWTVKQRRGKRCAS